MDKDDDGDDGFTPGGNATFPLSIMGQNGQNAQSGQNAQNSQGGKGRQDKKQARRKYLDTYCENLTSITINAQVGEIGLNIANCSGDQDYNPTPAFDLTLTVSTPPSIQSAAFDYSTINHIYVPADAVETYKSTSNWSQFKDIITAIQ